MKTKLLTALLTLFTLVSCSNSGDLNNQITGLWTMEKVYEYDNDVTAKHNPENNRWIEFNEDGTFVSDGDPVGRNTGRWRMDHENSILYLDSDTEGDDSEWNVSFEGNETIWTGIGHPRKENTRLVHKRKLD